MKSGERRSHYSANSCCHLARQTLRRARAPLAPAEVWCTVMHASAEFGTTPATFCKVGVMKIVIAGGSGFLGSPLAEMYAEDGHDVRVLTRVARVRRDAARSGHGRPGITRVGWKPDGAERARGPRPSKAPTGSSTWRASRWRRRRWSPERRGSSGTAASWRRAVSRPPSARPRRRPPCLVSGSAVGYYGPSDDPAAHRERPRRDRFPGPTLRRLGEGSAPGRTSRNAGRPAAHRHRPRTIRRRAAGDDAAVQVLRRRTARIGPAVRVVDPPARLDRDRALDRADAGRDRPRERHGTPPRHQPRTSRARSAARCTARASLPAPGFAVKLVVGEFADSVLHRPARPARPRAEGRLPLSVSGDRAGVQGDLRGVRLINSLSKADFKSPKLFRGEVAGAQLSRGLPCSWESASWELGAGS